MPRFKNHMPGAPMFHWQNAIYFGRRGNGDVRILKFDRYPGIVLDVERPYYVDVEAANHGEKCNAVFDVTIPVTEWASIIASVSARGEISEQYQKVLGFHGA